MATPDISTHEMINTALEDASALRRVETIAGLRRQLTDRAQELGKDPLKLTSLEDDQKAFQLFSFPIDLASAIAEANIAFDCYLMLRDNPSRKMPQAVDLFDALDLSPKPITIEAKSVTHGLLEGGIPIDPLLSRQRDLNDGKGLKPEYFQDFEYKEPAPEHRAPVHLSFAKLLKRLQNSDKYQIKRIIGDSIIIADTGWNRTIAGCAAVVEHLGELEAEYRIDFSNDPNQQYKPELGALLYQHKDSLSIARPDLLAELQLKLLTNINETDRAHLIDLREKLVRDKTLLTEFKVMKRIFRAGTAEDQKPNWEIYEQHGRNGSAVGSDVDVWGIPIISHLTRLDANPNEVFSLLLGPHASELKRTNVREEAQSMKIALAGLFAKAEERWKDEPEWRTVFRKNLIREYKEFLCKYILHKDELSHEKCAEALYENFTRNTLPGEGSAFNLFYCEIIRVCAFNKFLASLPSEFVTELQHNEKLWQQFINATGFFCHHPDTNYNPHTEPRSPESSQPATDLESDLFLGEVKDEGVSVASPALLSRKVGYPEDVSALQPRHELDSLMTENPFFSQQATVSSVNSLLIGIPEAQKKEFKHLLFGNPESQFCRWYCEKVAGTEKQPSPLELYSKLSSAAKSKLILFISHTYFMRTEKEVLKTYEIILARNPGLEVAIPDRFFASDEFFRVDSNTMGWLDKQGAIVRGHRDSHRMLEWQNWQRTDTHLGIQSLPVVSTTPALEQNTSETGCLSALRRIFSCC